MTPETIAERLKSRFGDTIAEVNVGGAHPHVVVGPEKWREVARHLRDDPELKFDWLRCISGVDLLEDKQFAVVFDFHSTQAGAAGAPWSARHAFAVKVKLPRDNAHLPSVADLWGAADWHERETYDLFGIVFDGHPDSVEGSEGLTPRRILLSDDWDGHPLCKDYVFPMEYHGIPATTEYNQTRQQH